MLSFLSIFFQKAVIIITAPFIIISNFFSPQIIPSAEIIAISPIVNQSTTKAIIEEIDILKKEVKILKQDKAEIQSHSNPILLKTPSNSVEAIKSSIISGSSQIFIETPKTIPPKPSGCDNCIWNMDKWIWEVSQVSQQNISNVQNTTGLVITSVLVEPKDITIDKNIAVDFIWTTNKPTNSKIFLLISGNRNILPSISGLSTNHSATFSGLIPDQNYSFEIESIDSSGSQVAKHFGTFNIPVFSKVLVSISDTRLSISEVLSAMYSFEDSFFDGLKGFLRGIISSTVILKNESNESIIFQGFNLKLFKDYGISIGLISLANNSFTLSSSTSDFLEIILSTPVEIKIGESKAFSLSIFSYHPKFNDISTIPIQFSLEMAENNLFGSISRKTPQNNLPVFSEILTF